MNRISKSPADIRLVEKIGEDLAVAKLLSDGCVIIERNFRSKSGEIDIICTRNDTTFFVDVEVASGDRKLNPSEEGCYDSEVSTGIKKTAEEYMQSRSTVSADSYSFKKIVISINEIDYY